MRDDPRLSDAEQRVFDRLVTGMSAREISTELFIEMTTVRSHIKHILTKHGENSQLPLVCHHWQERLAALTDAEATARVDPLSWEGPLQKALHDYLSPHPELGQEVDDRGCVPCFLIARAVAPTAAMVGQSQSAPLCRHCGEPPEADGDHTCECPYSDDNCPDHPPEGKPVPFWMTRVIPPGSSEARP
jgi:DNA-binding CsgD family transcriptional regulator